MSVKVVDYGGTNEAGVDVQHNQWVLIKDANGNDMVTPALVSGAITTKNLVPTGTATAGSAVEISLGGSMDSVGVQVVGTYTGDLSLQGTIDGTNWFTFGGAPFSNVVSGNTSAVIPSGLTGGFQTDAATMTKVRVTGLGTMTGSATVTLKSSTAAASVALDSSLPLGTNEIGRAVTRPGPPDLTQLAIEGVQLDVGAQSSSIAIVAAGAAFANASSAGLFLAPAGNGRAAYVDEILITASGGAPFNGTGFIAQGGYSTTWRPQMSEVYYFSMPADGGVVPLKIKKYCLQGTLFMYTFTSVAGVAMGQQPFSLSARGFSFTDDWNWGARSRILVCGDSLSYGNMGTDASAVAYMNKWLYGALVTKAVNSGNGTIVTGKNARLINKGHGASTATTWAGAFTPGSLSGALYDNIITGIDYDLMIVALGTNDCAGGTSTTVYEAALKEFIYERNTHRPTASIIFVTPPPSDTATRTTLASYRTSVITVATDATIGGAANKVYYHDVFPDYVTDSGQATGLNTAAGSDTNFANGERIAGSRLHPSGIGHQLIAFGPTRVPTVGAGLYGKILTTDFYKNYA